MSAPSPARPPTPFERQAIATLIGRTAKTLDRAYRGEPLSSPTRAAIERAAAEYGVAPPPAPAAERKPQSGGSDG